MAEPGAQAPTGAGGRCYTEAMPERPKATAQSPATSREPSDRALAGAALVLAAGVILSFWRLHVDNNDASLYVLVGRRLAADGTPFLLRYPRVLLDAPFLEHPPLFFWLEATVLRLAPILDLRLIGAACGLVTVASTFAIGRSLLGGRAALLGCFVLVATDAFSNYQPLARLDPPLTAAFSTSVALIVTSRGRWGRVLAGGLVAGAGVLVKGPPALGAPLVAAGLLAASGDTRSLASLACWSAGFAGAVVPPASFLVYDRLSLGGTWWNGYVLAQLVESAVGRRRGGLGPWPILKNAIVGRFWPGLPLALVALLRTAVPARRAVATASPAVRWALLGWGLLVYLEYASAGRPYWWYLMPAYPGLALLAGAGVEDLVGAARGARVITWCQRIGMGTGLGLLILLPLKVLQPLERPCPFGGLPARARALAEGRQVAIVIEPRDYSTQVTFAEHCECDPVTRTTFEEASRVGAAVVLARRAASAPPGWKEVAVNGDWSLLEQGR